jgi:hypothetical protein
MMAAFYYNLELYMSKQFAAAIIAASFATGCASSSPSPQASSPPPATTITLQTQTAFPNAQTAAQLDASLTALKATLDEGNLTAAEYTSARTGAIRTFYRWVAARRAGHQPISAETLHDEVGYLSYMNKQHELSDDEFTQTKSAVVDYYLSLGE